MTIVRDAKYHRDWAKANPDKIKAARKKYNDSHKAEAKAKRIEKLYGISHEEFLRMKDQQNGRCAICGNSHVTRDNNRVELDIDHCHITGKVRGLLCTVCNRGIGYLQDSPEIVRKALDYLEKFSKKETNV